MTVLLPQPRPVRAAPQRRPSSDPFFDKPYEADPSADPAWETKSAAGQVAPAGGGSGLSRFLKPKRSPRRPARPAAKRARKRA